MQGNCDSAFSPKVEEFFGTFQQDKQPMQCLFGVKFLNAGLIEL